MRLAGCVHECLIDYDFTVLHEFIHMSNWVGY